MIADASLAIVVCADSSVQTYHDFLHEDCAASAENMLLCIHNLGLGAVWCRAGASLRLLCSLHQLECPCRKRLSPSRQSLRGELERTRR